jgi:SPX domain protein involved in polyphosphate accumulation
VRRFFVQQAGACTGGVFLQQNNFANNSLINRTLLSFFVLYHDNNYITMANDYGSNKVNIDRQEDKYIVPKKHLPTLLMTVMEHLSPSYPKEDTYYCLVKSLYFDSVNLDFLRQHLEGQEHRIKMRIRAYGPNGEYMGDKYIEDKSKKDGISHKQRLCVDDNIAQEITETKQIPDSAKLRSLNKDIDDKEFEQKLNLLNYIMLSYKVFPCVEIQYKRYAFEKGKLRITIDQDIRVTPEREFSKKDAEEWSKDKLWSDLMDYTNSYSNSEDIILEIKHDEDVPEWVNKMLEELDLECKPFSKYVWSLGSIFRTILKLTKGT